MEIHHVRVMDSASKLVGGRISICNCGIGAHTSLDKEDVEIATREPDGSGIFSVAGVTASPCVRGINNMPLRIKVTTDGDGSTRYIPSCAADCRFIGQPGSIVIENEETE